MAEKDILIWVPLSAAAIPSPLEPKACAMLRSKCSRALLIQLKTQSIVLVGEKRALCFIDILHMDDRYCTYTIHCGNTPG